MSTLYIRLPSKASAEAAPHWVAMPCPYATVASNGNVEREGIEPLSQLAEMVAKARHVVLLIAASDVSLLRMQVPPLPPAKLKAALPNLVEDHLITDPMECVIVAGPAAEGNMRTIAVVQRAWLEILSSTFIAWKARHITAIPSQLCLPVHPDKVTASVTGHEVDIDVALRVSEHEGIGLPILPEEAGSAPRDVLSALLAVAPHTAITLYVPEPAVEIYRHALSEAGEAQGRLSIEADHWDIWIRNAGNAPLDLMTGIGSARSGKVDWRRWRWPTALAALLLMINVAGMNIQWMRMKNEADTLRATMLQIYRSAYPNEPVVDPVAQLRQKIQAARRMAGQPAPDDFLMLAAGFGEAWASVMPRAANTSSLAGMEYRERSLFVRFRPGGTVPAEQLKEALARRNLSFAAAPSQPGTEIWQVRRSQ